MLTLSPCQHDLSIWVYKKKEDLIKKLWIVRLRQKWFDEDQSTSFECLHFGRRESFGFPHNENKICMKTSNRSVIFHRFVPVPSGVKKIKIRRCLSHLNVRPPCHRCYHALLTAAVVRAEKDSLTFPQGRAERVFCSPHEPSKPRSLSA